MAFSQITTAEVSKNKPHTDTLGIKFKNNFDAHEARLNATPGSKNSIPWDALTAQIKFTYEEVTTATTLDATHGVLIADNSGEAFDVTFPLAASFIDTLFVIGQKGANATNLLPSGSDLLVDEVSPAGTDGISPTIGIGDGKMLAFISDGVSLWRKVWSSQA